MQLFRCPQCGARVYFENVRCAQCGADLIFDPQALAFSAEPRQRCGNADRIGCNWAAADEQSLCLSCATNVVIPPDKRVDILAQWRRTEEAKRRLLWSLLRLNLWPNSQPVTLRFQLATPDAPLPPSMDDLTIGHANGCITIDVSEARADVRHNRKDALGESYRTLLGHFRHETAHYLWDILVRDSDLLSSYRHCFGDEQSDYTAALSSHYDAGPPHNWHQSYISAYASSHPWEDWAETCAHVLHMMDLVETQRAFESAHTDILSWTFDSLLESWFPLVEKLTSLTRSLGHEDPYPFVLNQAIREKLDFAWLALTRGISRPVQH